MSTPKLIEDIEESAEVLDDDSEREWISAHKKVLFSAIDYSLLDVASQVADGDLDLQPQYQRRLRWSPERKSRLIESFLMNVPIPPLFLSEEADGKYAVIDGKQRITAISDFLNGDLALEGLKYFKDLNTKRFADLPTAERNFLSKRIPLRAVIILEQSPEDIRVETFQRLNTGGVTLNAQEIRNIAFRGPLNDLVMNLSVDKRFQKMLRIKDPRTSAMHQQMRDAELVLRFFAFRDSWSSFDGSIKAQMDEFMRKNKQMGTTGLRELEKSFHQTLDVVDGAFGEHAYARFQPDRKQWRRQVVAALYDAEMLAAKDLDASKLSSRSAKVIDGMKKLFADEEFRNATEAATNAKKAFETRITAVEKLLKRCLL